MSYQEIKQQVRELREKKIITERFAGFVLLKSQFDAEIDSAIRHVNDNQTSEAESHFNKARQYYKEYKVKLNDGRFPKHYNEFNDLMYSKIVQYCLDEDDAFTRNALESDRRYNGVTGVAA